MRVDVYKATQDDWYPSYEIKSTGEKIVSVSFLRFLDNSGWRVCVWGGDDCGMEKDFEIHQEAMAWTTFLEVIGMEYVNRDPLLNLGFWSA